MSGYEIVEEMKNNILTISEIKKVELWRDINFNPFETEDLPAVEIRDAKSSAEDSGYFLRTTHNIEVSLFVEKKEEADVKKCDDLIDKIVSAVGNISCKKRDKNEYVGYEKDINQYSDALILQATINFEMIRIREKII